MVDPHADLSPLAEVVGRLGLHEHLCIIYDTQEQQLAAALPYLRTGLDRGEKCLYVTGEKGGDAVLDALCKGGTDVDRHLGIGTLTIAHKKDFSVKEGLFDPDLAFSLWSEAAVRAKANGFSGLRILGEGTWTLGPGGVPVRLVEYESKLNHLVRDHDVMILCQYHRTEFPPEFILGMIRTHPTVVYGGIVCKNPYYVPADEFLKPNQPAREVERLLQNILAWERDQEALRHSEDHLRRVIDTVPALIHTGRPDGSLDFFNQRWLDFAGLSLADLEGWKWTAAFHPEDVDATVERWRASIATGEPFEHEGRVRRADGEYRWMLHRKVPLRDERGNIIKWYGSSTDIEDRKRAEEELRQSEERYRNFISHSSEGVWRLELRRPMPLGLPEDESLAWLLQYAYIAECNDAFAQIIGLHRTEEVEGKLLRDLLPASDEERLESFRSAARGGWQSRTVGFRGRDLAGNLKHVLRTEVPIVENGKLVRTWGLTRDITELKRAEEALRRSEERLRRIIDTIPTMAWSVRPDGTVDFLNRPWLDYSGLSLEQYIKDPTRPIHPEDVPKVLKKWPAHMAAGISYEDEMRLRRADGEYRWFLVRTVPLRDEHGNIVKWYGSSIDIEDRKRAEEELRDSEERFRATFENAGIAMALVDVAGHPYKCNRALQKMLGYSQEELSRMAFTEFTHPDDRELDWELYSELTAGKRDKYQIEKRYLKKGGGVVWGLLVVSLIKDQYGRPTYAIGMVEDITERKKAEEALRRSRDELRSLAARAQIVREEERTRVAREIHDELGQALTAIKIDLSSVISGLPAERKAQSESILTLVNATIQSVRRIATELRPIILDELGLVAAVEWACEEFQARTGIKCRWDLTDENVVIDSERATALFRIFQETLTNVARHAGATEVNVRLARDDGGLKLEVHDNGRGFSEEQLSVDSSLGILGMRERALLLGGELTISGAAGKGTTVIARIPETSSTLPKVK